MQKKYAIHLLIFLFAIFYSQNVIAQQPFYRNIGINEGLPSTEMYSSLQDSKGYLWFSSDAGVCRFNGRTFTCFTVADGLPDNTVLKLIEDKKGRIWMTCFSGEICYFENEKIHTIGANPELHKKLLIGPALINSLGFDDNDTLWVGTTRTLYKIPPRNNYSDLLTDNSFNDTTVFAISILNSKTAINSRYFYNQTNSSKNLNYASVQIKDKNSVRSSVVNFNTNGLYLPVLNSLLLKNGDLLFTYRNMLHIFSAGGMFSEKIFPQNIIMLNQDRLGNVWVGLSKGGVYFFRNGEMETSGECFFENFSISSVLIDNENGLWFNTLEKGLFYSPFFNYYSFPDSTGLSEKITGIELIKYPQESQNELVFVSNYKNEISILYSDDSIKKLPVPTEKNTSAIYNFYSLNNKLIICGNHLSEINPENGDIKFYVGDKGGSVSGIAMAQISENKMACLTYGPYYEIENGIITKNLNMPSRGTCMLKAKDGKLWVGTNDGLYYLEDSVFVPVKDENQLLHERVTSITQDDAGRLYISTRNRGVFICDNKKWSSVNTKSGLPSDLCNYVFADSTETVWIATNKGISFFNLNNRTKITTIDISDGLPTNEVTKILRRGNSLFAATRNGLCEIHLNELFTNTIAPIVYFSDVFVNDKKNISATNSTFEYDQNNFRFYIDCITFKSLFMPRYAYRLNGNDTSFKYSTNPFIEFLHLPPGNYSLEVFGINNNGIISAKSVTYKFTINKAWWNTWWFRFFELFLTIIIIYQIVRLRIRNVKRQETEKNKFNKTIAEYQMTALQAQMNPHFIFNAINSIQDFVLKNEAQPAYDYLTKFSKLVRLVLNNSKENVITLENEIETLQLYIEMEQLRFKNSFTFKLEIDPSIHDISEIKIPTMLIQPYIENAIWHGIMPLENVRHGLIKLDFFLKTNKLRIIIEDNGVGREHSEKISKAEGHKSMGIELVNEKFRIIEKTNRQKTSVKIIDLYDENKKPSGTRIELEISSIEK